MCEYWSLYYGDDGYIVRCKRCGLYQIAFLCIVVTLTDEDFLAFCRIVKRECEIVDYSYSENSKSIFIQTPAKGISFLLTKCEIKRLAKILEEGDTEAKALYLLSLFN